MDTEDRELFVERLDEIDVKTIKSEACEDIQQARVAAKTSVILLLYVLHTHLGGLGEWICR